MTDNYANEENVEADDLQHTAALMERTNHRQTSVASALSVSRDTGKEATPRRSRKTRPSVSVVHELRDGTKYVDDDGSGNSSVIHELRDGLTYVDE
jgi:UPF0288 family protein (methanogenesis marker protein 3)